MKTTGLNLFPRTQIDVQIINKKLNEAGLTLEWNYEFGCFFLEEDEECYDELELLIDEEFKDLDVNYRIEGIF